MRTPVVMTSLMVFLYVWASINPRGVRVIVAELKRWWRLYLIQRGGEHATQVLACHLVKSAAKKHIDPHVVHKVLTARRLEMIERLGRRYADEVLGKPTPLERYS